jgi:hypothetical protein
MRAMCTYAEAMARKIIRRARPQPDPLDGIPAELHEALSAYSRAVLEADRARRALTVAAARFPVRMAKLERIARQL